ncbi:MAG: hypothetical protein PHQ74_13675 [Crocinitomicaceae bacterium]|nr:hypothetical protein [Crocinitomicaceae bacterium]
MGKLIVLLFLLVVLPINDLKCQVWDFREGTSYGSDTQFGIGIASLVQFNLPRPLMGININYKIEGFEEDIFNKSMLSYFNLGASYFFKQGKVTRNSSFTATPKDTLPGLENLSVPFTYSETISYLTFQLGMDYVFHELQTSETNFYMGWVLGFDIPFYRGRYAVETFDKSKYELLVDEDWRITTKENGAGFMAGIKIGVDVSVGIFDHLYFEVTPTCHLSSKQYLLPNFSIGSHFFITGNFGYRRDL